MFFPGYGFDEENQTPLFEMIQTLQIVDKTFSISYGTGIYPAIVRFQVGNNPMVPIMVLTIGMVWHMATRINQVQT